MHFQVGDRVLLSSENITPDNQRGRPSRKLAPRFIGPYTIVEKIGSVAYRLKLPANLRIHPTFHVSRLRLYKDPLSFDPNRKVPPHPEPDIIDGEPEWEVEQILDKRLRGPRNRRRTEYLVKWVGYSDEHNSWEPESNLEHSQDIIRDFESRQT